MPWQLREGLKRRPRNAPPRPIAEQLPHINVTKLRIPKDGKIYQLPNISLLFPFVGSARISRDWIEFKFSIRRVEGFDLKHIKTGFGIRHAFICTCGRPTLTLYYHSHSIACRRCQKAIYASQACNQQQRPVLQASRIDSFLTKPRLFKRTKQRLLKKLGHKVMLAQTRMGTDGSRLRD